MKPMQECYIYT